MLDRDLRKKFLDLSSCSEKVLLAIRPPALQKWWDRGNDWGVGGGLTSQGHSSKEICIMLHFCAGENNYLLGSTRAAWGPVQFSPGRKAEGWPDECGSLGLRPWDSLGLEGSTCCITKRKPGASEPVAHSFRRHLISEGRLLKVLRWVYSSFPQAALELLKGECKTN